MDDRKLSGFRFETIDFNLDGTLDFLMLGQHGLINVEYGGHEVGRNGNVSLDELGADNGFRLTLPRQLYRSSNRIVNVGDVNGDSTPDIAISGGYDAVGYLLLGGEELSLLRNSTTSITALSSASSFGTNRIVSGGDLNNDGINDIYVMSSDPAARIVFGAADIAERLVEDSPKLLLDGTDGFQTSRETSVISGIYPFESLLMPAYPLDFNGDGLQDLMLDETPHQAAYVIYGTQTSGGTSEIAETADIPSHGIVRYEVSGTFADGVNPSGSWTSRAITCYPSSPSNDDWVSTNVESMPHPTLKDASMQHVSIANQTDHAISVDVEIQLPEGDVTTWVSVHGPMNL